MHGCTEGQTLGIEWLAIGGNAVESLDEQALREEQGAYKILQAICHNLVSVSVGFERFRVEFWKHTRRFGKR
jgi:hypothetical protein